MSALTRLSLANRALALLIAVAAVGFGLLAIPSLKQQLIPSLTFPAAFVTAQYAGASPEVVESQVVQPIEDAVRGVSGVTGTTSTAYEGFATIQVEFAYGTDIDRVVSRMQSQISRISSTLPDGADPQVLSGTTDDFLPTVALSASTSGDTGALAQKLNKLIVPELSTLDGVRSAEVTGAPSYTLAITPKQTAPPGVAQVIAATLQGAGKAIPAGVVAEGDKSLAVQVGGSLTSIDDVKGLHLTGGGTAGQAPTAGAGGGVDLGRFTIGDVADVKSIQAPSSTLTRTNGVPSLGVSLLLAQDGNAVDVSHAVADRVDDWQKTLGGDAKLTVVFDQGPYIEKSIEGLATEGGLGLIMAVIVILVFLLSIRSTLVTAISIPLSVLIALIAMWVQGLSLNILTLGALTIAIGRVVDDSIVVLENIKRHLEYGEEKVHAIAQAAREVAGAITASTLTTVAVFLPITLVGGTVGELFRPFALTVTVALLASLLVALTVVPVFAFWFLKQPTDLEHPEQVRSRAEEKERRSVLQRVYVPVIRFAVRRRWSTIAISVVILIATLAMAPLLKTNFLDQSGQTTMNITQTLPVGTSLKATDEAARKVEDVLAEEKGAGRLVSYQTTIGGGQIPGLGGNSNNARYSLTVPDGTDVNGYTDDLTKKLGALSGTGEVKVGGGGGGGGFGSTNLQVVVQGPDTRTITDAAELIRGQMATISGLKDVTTDLAEQTPRIQVSAKPEAAAEYGLSDSALGLLVASAFRGIPAGQLSLDGVQQNVVVRTGTAPADVDAVKALELPTARGVVALGTVADVTESKAQAQITRIDGSRSATVEGTPTGDNLGAASTALTTKLKDLKLPAGATYTIGGATSDQNEAFSQLGLALLAAIVIVFVVMVGTFRSLVQPLILLVSIPFAATGALLSLLVTNTPLGVPALIGMLMLVGIVVTNAIVLLDLINQYRREGRPLAESVVEGGRHRLRPILMTACATIFALLPMAIGLTASGGFISQPLAVVVIGGLTTSTLLTLVLVPALYTMVEGRRDRRDARRERRRARREEKAAGEAVAVS